MVDINKKNVFFYKGQGWFLFKFYRNYICEFLVFDLCHMKNRS